MSEFMMPHVELANRPLNFFWLVDCSGSMGCDGKIDTVNCAIKNCIPEMRNVADENPNAQMMIQAMKFSAGAEWITAAPQKIEDYKWSNLTANSVTDLGAAYKKLKAQLAVEKLGDRALPPVIVLLSDGYPTDNYESPFQELLSEPWFKKAVRIAIAIGKDADRKVLEKFTGNVEYVLEAHNAEQLTSMIKWASTDVVNSVTGPKSDPDNQKGNIIIPNFGDTDASNLVW